MIISLVILLEIILTFFLRKVTIISNMNFVLLIIVNTVLLLYLLYKDSKITKQEKFFLGIGFLVRIIILFIDEYLFRIPFNSGDATRFDEMAINISNNLKLLDENNLYGGMYSKLLGVLYYCMGNARIFAQSLNVFLGYGTIYLLFMILKKRNFENIKIKIFLQLMIAFFPITIIFSICLLRESVMIFLIIASLKNCLDYIEKKQFYKILISFLCVFGAAMFHSGNMLIIFGYMLIFAFYEHENNQIKISLKNIGKFIITFMIIIVINLMFSNLFANKFTREFETIQENEETTEQSDEYADTKSFIKNNPITRALEKEGRGDSSYIEKREVKHIGHIILYTCERVIYFLFSPMPWKWRGIMDCLVFLADSMFYFIFIINVFIRLRKIDKTERILVLFLTFGVALTIVAYALGTLNAGTALRHRHKFLYYIIIVSVFCNTKKVRNLDA